MFVKGARARLHCHTLRIIGTTLVGTLLFRSYMCLYRNEAFFILFHLVKWITTSTVKFPPSIKVHLPWHIVSILSRSLLLNQNLVQSLNGQRNKTKLYFIFCDIADCALMMIALRICQS